MADKEVITFEGKDIRNMDRDELIDVIHIMMSQIQDWNRQLTGTNKAFLDHIDQRLGELKGGPAEAAMRKYNALYSHLADNGNL